jgi:2-dehydro-3-deoxyphosphogluconate aldolase/(4S)-4-hydroxy-2-oxoglutarate aldolase
MNKSEEFIKIVDAGVIAVIRGSSPELTVKTVDALVTGGVNAIEITYSTPNAVEVVRELHEKYADKIILGMGTLTELHQPEEATEAGASFLVSPICEETLVKKMVESGLFVMAGALTPTEVFQAYRLGSDVVKVFPGSLAGPSYLKALKGPFPYIKTMPTGGVSKDNVREWFAAGAIAVGAGSELCPSEMIKTGRFAEISEIAHDFRLAVDKARDEIGKSKNYGER